MHIRILGSAAGGGLPQWNCRCANCEAARSGSPDVRPRTQSSVAVSADDRWWFLLNVSPDIRQQILAFPPLGPSDTAERSTSIAGCVLTDAEIDHTAGLLLLREGQIGCVYGTATVRRWLNRWLPIEPILASFSNPTWSDLPLNAAVDLQLPDGASGGLRVQVIELAGHAPRFVKDNAEPWAGSVVALQVIDDRTGGKLLYAPCIAALEPPLLQAAETADCIMLDGTFWDDAEPIRSGIGNRTATQMGHLPVSGPAGSLDRFGRLIARHRLYIHINNTNPILNERGAEHRLVGEGGIRVAADEDTFEL